MTWKVGKLLNSNLPTFGTYFGVCRGLGKIAGRPWSLQVAPPDRKLESTRDL